jgi:UDP-glucuronate 4-epimerase
MRILVTGAAGFIGYHLCERLISLGHEVTGLDNINDYYSVDLKYARLKQLGISQDRIAYNQLVASEKYPGFEFIKLELQDREHLPALCERSKFDVVCNLAAQAGVRYSIEQPFAYIDSNISGFLNVLEACRDHHIRKLVYASSSSVYGLSDQIPFSTANNTDHPISLYAATKKSNELMAHTYSHLFDIQMVGLRFFTVYGPWGRPDMAMFLFTDAILHEKPIQVFNHGELSRDFTYIDDIVNGVVSTVENDLPVRNSLYNIGNSRPVKLLDFINEIEQHTGKLAIKEMLPMQAGDVEKTWADVSDLQKDFGYQPSTDITEGVRQFVEWYRSYYGV